MIKEEKDLIQRLKILRRMKGITLAEITKATGISKATLSLIENLKQGITLEKLIKITKALGIKFNHVMIDEKSEREIPTSFFFHESLDTTQSCGGHRKKSQHIDELLNKETNHKNVKRISKIASIIVLLLLFLAPSFSHATTSNLTQNNYQLDMLCKLGEVGLEGVFVNGSLGLLSP